MHFFARSAGTGWPPPIVLWSEWVRKCRRLAPRLRPRRAGLSEQNKQKNGQLETTLRIDDCCVALLAHTFCRHSCVWFHPFILDYFPLRCAHNIAATTGRIDAHSSSGENFVQMIRTSESIRYHDPLPSDIAYTRTQTGIIVKQGSRLFVHPPPQHTYTLTPPTPHTYKPHTHTHTPGAIFSFCPSYVHSGFGLSFLHSQIIYFNLAYTRARTIYFFRLMFT